MVIDTPSLEVRQERKSGIELVLPKDVVSADGTDYSVPGRARLTSGLLKHLLARSTASENLALLKDSLIEELGIGSVGDIVKDRGYLRFPVEYLPFQISVQARLRTSSGRTYSVEFVEEAGQVSTVSLRAGEADVIIGKSMALFLSYASLYDRIGLSLLGTRARIGYTPIHQYFICDFPGLPETSEIVDAQGEKYDYRLLLEGQTDKFLERYQEIWRRFDLPNDSGHERA